MKRGIDMSKEKTKIIVTFDAPNSAYGMQLLCGECGIDAKEIVKPDGIESKCEKVLEVAMEYKDNLMKLLNVSSIKHDKVYEI